MIPVLLVFSLLLHFVTFYLIIVLTQRLNHLKSTSGGDISNIEAILHAHLEGVRKENEVLISDIEKYYSRKVTAPSPTASLKPSVKKQPVTPKDVPVQPQKNIEPTKDDEVQKEQPAFSLPVNDIVDQVERSEVAEVLHLSDQGLSVSDIAKKLNMGKGEVELIINLNHKRSK